MKNLLLILAIFSGIVNMQSQTPKPVYYFNPDWSPDGSRILFESTRDGKFAIYTIRPDGSDLKKLTNGQANDEQGQWSPDGRQIVFSSDQDGDLRLYLMNSDGGNRRQLTKSKDIDFLPRFSPKGDLIAFMSSTEKGTPVTSIFVIRPDGTGRKRLTDENFSSASPEWSPNGEQILFVRSPIVKRYYKDITKEEMIKGRAAEDIFVMNKDGSQTRQLTDNQVNDCCARWSSDGKKIYFKSARDGSVNAYAMNPDGTGDRKVNDERPVQDAVISRDGKYFAYTKKVDGKYALFIYEVKTVKDKLLIGG